MGYIAEPAGVTLTVINKGMSETEKKELSKIIQQSKKRTKTVRKPYKRVNN
jgi:hypothetical protein